MEFKFIDAGIQDKSFNDDERSFVAYASKNTIDRDNEIIEADAWDYSNYKKNPVVLWAHDYSALPVGRALWVKRDKDGLLFKPSFADTEEGTKIYDLYKQGVLRAFSVGFHPRKWYDPGEDEKAKKPKAKRVYTDVELLEVSCVSVPANQDALVQLYNDGGIESEALKVMIKSIAPAGSLIEDEPVNIEKPYPTEHACRLRDPGDFQANSFRRSKREHEGKEYSVIMGKLTGETAMTEQAYRYKKDVWTAAEAKAHCNSHDGISFEAASSESSVDLTEILYEIKELRLEVSLLRQPPAENDIDIDEDEIDIESIKSTPEIKIPDDIKLDFISKDIFNIQDIPPPDIVLAKKRGKVI